MVPAAFEDDHPLACFGEHRRGDTAAAARADHDDVCLERRLTGDGDDLECLAGVGRRVLGRARISHAGPERIAPLRSWNAVREKHRKLVQRSDPCRGLGRYGGNVAENLFAAGLGLILEFEQAGAVDQLQQAGALLVGHLRQQIVLGGHVGADIAALGCVEPVRVVLAWHRCHEGVDDRGQRLALQGGEFDGHGVTFRVGVAGSIRRRR